jgi:hypothetical protein
MKNYTRATSEAGGTESGGAGGGSTLSRLPAPGNNRSMGDQLWDALMPLQPAVTNNNKTRNETDRSNLPMALTSGSVGPKTMLAIPFY